MNAIALRREFLRNGFATDDDCVARDLRKRSPFYQDFIARCGLADWAGVRIGRGANVWNLSLQRAVGQQPFSTDELSCLGRLSERLDPVVEVASALALSRGEASLDALQFSGRAALLVDRAGSVVLANQAAETLVGPDLIISGGRIRSFDPKATDRLHLALRALLWTQMASVLSPVVFPKADGGRLIIYLMRTKGLAESPLAAFHAILVIVDPAAEQVLTAQSMKQLFNLTPAETRLATAILNGQEIAAFAFTAGLSKETVRNQLKSIFGKTGTRRQPELTALLRALIPDR